MRRVPKKKVVTNTLKVFAWPIARVWTDLLQKNQAVRSLFIRCRQILLDSFAPSRSKNKIHPYAGESILTHHWFDSREPQHNGSRWAKWSLPDHYTLFGWSNWERHCCHSISEAVRTNQWMNDFNEQLTMYFRLRLPRPRRPVGRTEGTDNIAIQRQTFAVDTIVELEDWMRRLSWGVSSNGSIQQRAFTIWYIVNQTHLVFLGDHLFLELDESPNIRCYQPIMSQTVISNIIRSA